MLRSNSPGPVCGQRQCLVRKGGNVGKRDQRSDTPDQSAARGTTLELMFRRAIKTGKGKSRWKERRKWGWRWKSGPVCGQKDQAQHPKGTRNKERAGTRGRERETTTRARTRTETRERKKQTQTKRRDRSTSKNKKGARRAEAQQSQGKRGEKQEREGGARIVTPSVPISGWPGEQGLGLKDQGATMKQVERRGTDSPDQSAARKARYQLKENNQENTSTGKDRRQGDVKPMNRQWNRSEERRKGN